MSNVKLEQEDVIKVIKACKLVKEVYPDMTGNVQFNLHAGREKVNVNVGYSIIIQPDEYFGTNPNLGQAV